MISWLSTTEILPLYLLLIHSTFSPSKIRALPMCQRHLTVQQQLFQGGYWPIDFFILFFCPIMPRRGCRTDWLGWCAFSRVFVCFSPGVTSLRQCHQSILNEECNLNTCRRPFSDAWTKRHKQSMSASNTHTVDRIQTPIVSQLLFHRDILW